MEEAPPHFKEASWEQNTKGQMEWGGEGQASEMFPRMGKANHESEEETTNQQGQKKEDSKSKLVQTKE